MLHRSELLRAKDLMFDEELVELMRATDSRDSIHMADLLLNHILDLTDKAIDEKRFSDMISPYTCKSTLF